MKITKMDSPEKKRLEALETYEDFNGPIQASDCALNSANHYQAQQATEILAETLKTFLMQNPVILGDPALFRLGVHAQDALDAIGTTLSER
ncbi:hypothetical protein QD336_05265 [Rhizobium sp. BR 250]